MDFVTAFVLGVIQGVLEFLPVSSSGHLVILERLLGFNNTPVLPFHIFLHIGSVIAVLYTLRRDEIRLVSETGKMLLDCLRNMKEFLRSLRLGEDPDYVKVVRTNYRKLVVTLLEVSLPTALIGLLLRDAAVAASGSAMYTGIGLLLTGVVLLVASMLRPGNEMPRDIPGWKMLLIGTAQGISVLPGISRLGLTVSGGILCGLSKATAIRISFLMLVPAAVGALAGELFTGIPSGILSGDTVLICIIGMAASAAAGIFTMKRAVRFFRVRSMRGFAAYCFCAGTAAVFLGFFI